MDGFSLTTVFFFFNIILSILGFVPFQINFRISLSISTKHLAEILLEVALNL